MTILSQLLSPAIFQKLLHLLPCRPALVSWVLEPKNSPAAAPFLLLLEALVNLVTVITLPHFNIDWESYMQQVACLLQPGDHQYSYDRCRGQNGPLQYPGGHVWIYMALYKPTEYE